MISLYLTKFERPAETAASPLGAGLALIPMLASFTGIRKISANLKNTLRIAVITVVSVMSICALAATSVYTDPIEDANGFIT